MMDEVVLRTWVDPSGAWWLREESRAVAQMEQPLAAVEVEVLFGMGWYSKKVGSLVEELWVRVLELVPEGCWLVASF